MAVKQTAGRRDLGEFAPKFAELNDDVLFGEVWSREEKAVATGSFSCDSGGINGSGAYGFFFSISSDNSKAERRHPVRDCRDSYSCGILCGMAESMGGVSNCERSMERRRG